MATNYKTSLDIFKWSLKQNKKENFLILFIYLSSITEEYTYSIQNKV